MVSLPFATLPPTPWIDEEQARELYVALLQPDPRMAYDPLALLVLKPGQRQTFEWPEHPRGRITFVTNDRGLRDNEPTAAPGTGRRVLVLGDSQTEGMVHNQEAFAHVLESLLATRGQPAEVLNAGVGTTSPHNYLGQYLRLADLRPDLVIVVVYAGNDFAGTLRLDELIRQRPTTHMPVERLRDARDRWPTVLAQAFGQALLFEANPEAVEPAVEAVREVLLELDRQCRQGGARLLVATLPTKLDVDDDDRATQVELLALTGLAATDLAVNAELAVRLRERLAGDGIDALDLAPMLLARAGPHFWTSDYHLNVRGHETVAAALARHVLRGKPAR